MTQFRSKGKGKNRKTYPISERKPYGLTRNIAYSDVMALRKEGKRARLIKTNKKLDLYAPYESVISQNATNNVSSAPRYLFHRSNRSECEEMTGPLEPKMMLE